MSPVKKIVMGGIYKNPLLVIRPTAAPIQLGDRARVARGGTNFLSPPPIILAPLCVRAGN